VTPGYSLQGWRRRARPVPPAAVVIVLCLLVFAAGPWVYDRFERYSATSELDRLAMPGSWQRLADDIHRGPTFGLTVYHRIGRQFLAPAAARDVADDGRQIAKAAGWAVDRRYAAGSQAPECSADFYQECWSRDGYRLFLETADPDSLRLPSCTTEPDNPCTAVTWTIIYE
jgi:hypothetical protein